MNETIQTDRMSDVPWPTSDHRLPVPDTSMLPGSDNAPTPAIGLLKNAVQGAHDTIDRLADNAAPVARKIGESVSVAEESLHAKADAFRFKRDEWVDGMRTTVRSKPLTSIVVAAALGAMIARLTR